MSDWDVEAGLEQVRARIRAACARAGRAPESVQLLAVSKFQPLPALRRAYALGQREFGENYVQELSQKAASLADLPDVRWHLIGRLQSNKAKDVVQLGCTVQTLDSLRLADQLSKRAAAAQRELPVLLQVNLAAEPQKAGIAIAGLPQLAAAVRALPGLQLRGLMAIPNADASPATTRGHFRHLRELAVALQVPELSMGMSDDLELAIEEGSTLVRVGTAIFGPRPQHA